MSAQNTPGPLRTLAHVEGLADEASKPHRQSLPPHILQQLELAAVSVWVSAQDESVAASRVVEVAQQAVANIHRKYARGDAAIAKAAGAAA
jgi:hypothetical protein